MVGGLLCIYVVSSGMGSASFSWNSSFLLGHETSGTVYGRKNHAWDFKNTESGSPMPLTGCVA